MFSSNASLWKLNSELAAQLEELKSKNEELTTGHSTLIEKNAELISQIDGVRDELTSENAMSVGFKAELETAAEKIQTIVVIPCLVQGLNSWVSSKEVSTPAGTLTRKSRRGIRGQLC